MPERVFRLPDLGEGLQEGEIVAWLVAEGDEVELNQPLVEVETAKATVEIPSPFAGVIATLHAGAGDAVTVGAPLVTFDGVAGGAAEPEVKPEAKREAKRGERSDAATSGPIATTPAVRKLARDLGIDLEGVEGTGPGGRVTAEDVRRATETEHREPATASAQRIDVTPIRRAIARRLELAAAIPQVTTFRTVDATALEAFRAELRVSPLPVFVAALCRTIAGHPLLNATWTDDAVLTHDDVDVSVAVDTDRGLMVPVVRGASTLSIKQLASEIRRLAEAARTGTLSPDAATGSTISVSNTGSYGSEAGTPLLNPPNAVTIALGVIAPRPLVGDGGAVEARPACTISLTFDHRVLDGAAAGRALTDLVDLLESPDALRGLPR
jgi:2-oxoisovalerate dehydrogenase E2 component (dihydrolipoyl transacylase)